MSARTSRRDHDRDAGHAGDDEVRELGAGIAGWPSVTISHQAARRVEHPQRRDEGGDASTDDDEPVHEAEAGGGEDPGDDAEGDRQARVDDDQPSGDRSAPKSEPTDRSSPPAAKTKLAQPRTNGRSA